MQEVSLSDPKVQGKVTDASPITDKANEKEYNEMRRGRGRDIQSPLATTSTGAMDTDEGMEFSKKVVSKLETENLEKG